MSRTRVIRYLLCFVLFFGAFGCLMGNQVVLATQESSGGSFLSSINQEQPPPEEKLELSCLYPVLRDISGASFEFEVALKWQGSKRRTFELGATAPPKWTAKVIRGMEEQEAPAIELEPGLTYPDTVRVRLAPLAGELPEPGEYVVTLEASSGDIKEATELKAVVTALYRFAFYTATGLLNTEVTAGEDNHLSLLVFNSGQAVIEKIDLLSTKPQGWSITLNPDKAESLEPGLAQEVDAVIKPPRKTIAGDYMVTLTAISKDLPKREIELRVTVLTPTVWGWVAILIVLAVIAGLGVMFRRLGRR